MGVVEGFNGRYWVPKDGAFLNKKGDDEIRMRGLFGNLSRVTVKWDEGKPPKIQPGWKVNVSLTDGDEIEVISFRADCTFGWMFAQSLSTCNPGDRIIVETSPGKDDPSVCFAWVKRYTDNKKEDIERPQYPEDREHKIDQGIEDLKALAAKFENAPAATEDEYDPLSDN